MPEVIEFQSRLGRQVQQIDYENVPFAYFHCKKVGHKAKVFPIFIEKEKVYKAQIKKGKRKEIQKQQKGLNQDEVSKKVWKEKALEGNAQGEAPQRENPMGPSMTPPNHSRQESKENLNNRVQPEPHKESGNRDKVEGDGGPHTHVSAIEEGDKDSSFLPEDGEFILEEIVEDSLVPETQELEGSEEVWGSSQESILSKSFLISPSKVNRIIELVTSSSLGQISRMEALFESCKYEKARPWIFVKKKKNSRDHHQFLRQPQEVGPKLIQGEKEAP